MSENYHYNGNSIPYAAVLCHSTDRESFAPILDALASGGLKLCVLDEKSKIGTKLQRSCAVITLLSQAFQGSSALTEAMLAADRNGQALIPVRPDSEPLPEMLDRMLYSRNSIFLSQYSTTDEVVQRIRSASALQAPAQTDAQKKAFKRLRGILAGALVLVLVLAGIFIYTAKANHVRITEEQRSALAAYGITEEDLEKITAFVLVGDTLETTDVENLPDADSGKFTVEAYLYGYDYFGEWYRYADGQPVAPGTTESLSFLPLFPNLKTLILVGQPSQLPDLSGLAKLETVELISCEQADLTFLSGCTGLKSLRIMDCPQLNALAGLSSSGLQELSLRQSELYSISPLASCPALETLSLNTGAARAAYRLDYSSISALPGLKSLTVQNRPDLTELGFLSGLSALEELRISGCPKLADISALADTSALQVLELNLVEAPAVFTESVSLDLSALSALSELRELSLSGIATDLSFLKGSDFERLSFTGADLDLSALSALRSCRVLALADYSGADNLPYIPDLQVEDLSLTFNARGNSDLSALPSGLSSLSLSYYQGEDLAGLETQTALSSLALCYAPRLTDYNAIYGLELAALELDELSQLPDFSLLRFRPDAVLSLGENESDDLSCLDGLDAAYAQNANLTVRILSSQHTQEDFSHLERFCGNRVVVTPDFSASAQSLVAEGSFASFDFTYDEADIPWTELDPEVIYSVTVTPPEFSMQGISGSAGVQEAGAGISSSQWNAQGGTALSGDWGVSCGGTYYLTLNINAAEGYVFAPSGELSITVAGESSGVSTVRRSDSEVYIWISYHTEHQYEEDTDAHRYGTCQRRESKVFTCTNCGDTYTEYYGYGNHKWGGWIPNASGGDHYHVCSICGQTASGAHFTAKYKQWNDALHDLVCACGLTYGQAGHTMIPTDSGWYCPKCGFNFA